MWDLTDDDKAVLADLLTRISRHAGLPTHRCNRETCIDTGPRAITITCSIVADDDRPPEVPTKIRSSI
jgi:hypothetical protein